MSRIGEKVAYLKGLAEGLKIDETTDQGKLMLAMIGAMESIAQEGEELEARLNELSQYVEEIDDDVSEMEEALFSDEDDEDDDEDDDDDFEVGDEEDDGMIEYECPHCGTVVFFDEEAFDMEEEHVCPNCHRKIFEDDGGEGGDGE